MSGLNGENLFLIDKSTRCGSQTASNSVVGGQGWISGKIASCSCSEYARKKQLFEFKNNIVDCYFRTNDSQLLIKAC